MNWIFVLISLAGFNGIFSLKMYPNAKSDTERIFPFYTQTSLNTSRIFNQDLSLHFSFRTLSYFSQYKEDRPGARLYSGYVKYRTKKFPLEMKIGRHFEFQGDGGLLDGMNLKADFKKFLFSLYGGYKVSESAKFRFENENLLLGAFSRVLFKHFTGISLAYFRQMKGDTVEFERLSFYGFWRKWVNFVTLLSYDLLNNEISRFSFEGRKRINRASFYAEFLSFKSRFPKGYVFNTIFENPPIKNQVRAGFNIAIWRNLSARTAYRVTFIPDTNNSNEYEIGLSLSPYAWIAFRQLTGYPEDNMLFTGNISLPVKKDIHIFASVNQEILNKNFEKQAISYNAGILFRPFNSLDCHLEVQYFLNPEYNYNVRIFSSLTYRFWGKL